MSLDRFRHVVALKIRDLKLNPGDVLVRFHTVSSNFDKDMVSGVDVIKVVVRPVMMFCTEEDG